MGKNKSYEDLLVWKKSIALTNLIYTYTRGFPKDELYGLSSQIRRSAVSVASNIAEGCARNSYGEFIQFLGIATGSLAEVHTQLIIAHNQQYIKKEELKTAVEELNEIRRMLNGLKASLRQTPARNQQLVTRN